MLILRSKPIKTQGQQNAQLVLRLRLLYTLLKLAWTQWLENFTFMLIMRHLIIFTNVCIVSHI